MRIEAFYERQSTRFIKGTTGKLPWRTLGEGREGKGEEIREGDEP